MSEPRDEVHPMHFGLFIFGGLCVGTGLLNLYYSFGWSGGDLNSNFAQVGYTAMDNISLLPSADVSLPLIVIGALSLIFANATAWRETGGY